MKKLMIVLAVPMMLVSAMAVLEVSGGCGLLDAADEIWIELPAQTFPFALNADDIVTMLEDKLGVTLSGTEFPPGINVQETIKFETPPQDVDLSNEEKLKAYVQAGKVKSVKISSVTYNITENTLNYDLPVMEMYLDNLGVNGISQSSKLVATLNSIQAGTTGSGEVQWAPNGQDIMSDFLMSFQFAIIGQAAVEIDTAKNRSLPSGRIQGVVEVRVKFSVDPI